MTAAILTENRELNRTVDGAGTIIKTASTIATPTAEGSGGRAFDVRRTEASITYTEVIMTLDGVVIRTGYSSRTVRLRRNESAIKAREEP